MNEIRLEIDRGVAVITLAAPGRRNAFTPEMVGELVAACDEVDANSDVGGVVIRAEGDSFCAGAHRGLLAKASRDPAEAANYQALGAAYRGFTRVGELLAPSVAAVRGHAVGAGVNLMLSTDLRVIAESARVMAHFGRIGLHPGGGHFHLLGRLAGREAAAGLGLFSLEVDGRRAVELGLAWEALPEPDVEARALELAAQVARDPQLARAAARSFRLELGPPMGTWPAALELERAAQMWSLRRRRG